MTIRPMLPILAASILGFAACHKSSSGLPATLSVSPLTDTIGGIITITGSGFSPAPDSNFVLFNDSTRATVVSASATQLTVRVPYFSARDKIIVRSGNQIAQAAQEFVVAPKFSPLTEAPGYPLTLIVGGSITAADYTVSFNGTPATITKLIDAVMKVVVPDGATSGPITVNYKGKPCVSLQNFTVAPLGGVTTFATGFSNPYGLTVDGNGNLYVADLQGYIKKVTPDGVVSIFAGNGTWTSADGPALSVGFSGVFNMAFAPNGDMYITENWLSKIRKISGGMVSTVTQTGGPAASTVYSPAGICIDGSGNLFVSDDGFMQIKKVTPAGVVTVVAGRGTQGWDEGPAATAAFYSPGALVFDAAGNLLIVDVDKVRQLSPAGMVSTFAGSYRDFKDGVGAVANFNQMTNIAKDAAGNFYIADGANQLIRRMTPAGVVTTIAGSPGQKGKQDGSGVNALFNNPMGIAVGKDGAIYVSDQGNQCIRKILLR